MSDFNGESGRGWDVVALVAVLLFLSFICAGGWGWLR